MSISDNKQEIFGKIAALRAKSKGYLNKSSNSFSSVSNKTDSMSFLIDLLKSLEDFNEMKQVIIDTIIYQSSNIENDIKKNLKKSLNDLSLCSANPNIPTWMFESGTGIDFKVDKIDYLDIFKLIPLSQIGSLYFNDTTNGLDSKDFNTYLSNVISDNGGSYFWGINSPIKKNILKCKFSQYGVINNQVNTKISDNYLNQKLSKFNDDYIDSLEILSTESLINALLDGFSGILSFKSNKSKTKLKSEEEIKLLIDKMINTEDEISSIDNSFFEFSNIENINIDEIVNNKNKGIFKLNVTENIIEASLNYNDILNLNNNLSSTNNSNVKAELISNTLNSLGELDNINLDAINIPVVKLNIIEQIVKNLINVFVSQILSPKLLIIYLINLKIVYNEDFTDIKTFIQNNSILFKSLINIIKPIILKIILNKIIKKITFLIENKVIEIAAERGLNYSNQIRSLIGGNFDINNI